MANFTPPPTYADPVLKDENTGKFIFNPIWLKWFIDQAAFISSNGGTTGTISHESLSGLQGGAANDHNHLTSTQLADLISALAIIAVGFSGTGKIIRETAPTFLGASPIVSDATRLLKSSVSMNNGAGAALGTLANAPVAGDPTKWVPFDDNGTTRYFPSW